MVFAVFRISLAGPGNIIVDIIASFYIILINLYSCNCQAVCSVTAGEELRMMEKEIYAAPVAEMVEWRARGHRALPLVREGRRR